MNDLVKVDANGFTGDQVELIKSTICVGGTDDELKLFMMQCHRTGLDPFARQIYALKRWNGQQKREVMTVQTSIDGFRLIAERTGNYAPGSEPTFRRDDGQLVATAYVKKWVRGEWHTVAAEAYWDEYVQLTKDGKPTHMWAGKPRIMLAKCAEALALRKAFPQELSGLYTSDELGHADATVTVEATPAKPTPPADSRAKVADAIIKAMSAATDAATLKGAMSLAPNGWYTHDDEHRARVVAEKDRLKLGFLRDRIDTLAEELRYDAVKLGLIGQEVEADFDALDYAACERILAILESDREAMTV